MEQVPNTTPSPLESFEEPIASAHWIEVCGEISPKLAAEVRVRSHEHLRKQKLQLKDAEYVGALDRRLYKGTLRLSQRELEKLRLLCQLFEIKCKPQKITSHRPMIGPFIVAIKRLLYPIFELFLKDTLKQQRDFNAAAISLITDLAVDKDFPENRKLLSQKSE